MEKSGTLQVILIEVMVQLESRKAPKEEKRAIEGAKDAA